MRNIAILAFVALPWGAGCSSDVSQPAGDAAPHDTIVVSAASPLQGSGTTRGMSYWNWVKQWGDQVSGTETAIAALHPDLLRIGGDINDTSSPEPFTHAELDTALAYARAVGAEPIVQVPMLSDENGAVPTADSAASLVEYLNVTNGDGIRYFSLGNEPDLYPGKPGVPETYSPADYCATFRAFATAMRAVDPTIQIIGPELSWKYESGTNDWFTPFLQGCADQVDIVGVHRYPLQASEATIARAMSDSAQLRGTIDDLRARMSAAGAGDKPFAITETNITANGDPAVSTLEASPATFPAGLWVADVFGVALEKGLWAMTFWSVSEDYTLGFIRPSGQKTPAYYALRMYADHFGPTVLEVSGRPATLGVYASRTAESDATWIMVINRSSAGEDAVLRVTGAPVPVNDVSHHFPALSLTAVRIPDSGNADIFEYTSDDATLNGEPRHLGEQ